MIGLQQKGRQMETIYTTQTLTDLVVSLRKGNPYCSLAAKVEELVGVLVRKGYRPDSIVAVTSINLWHHGKAEEIPGPGQCAASLMTTPEFSSLGTDSVLPPTFAQEY
jgi:hypothetical protein